MKNTEIKPDLESDLIKSEFIVEKCKDDIYAQNLYAALCNNEFIRSDLVSYLKEEKWSCSWRYAGGIIADIRKEGDYMDWYCSGIINCDEPDEEIEEEILKTKKYVGESVVTDEIRNDLKKIGWNVL